MNLHVTVEEYDLTVRKRPLKLKKVGEFTFSRSELLKRPADTAMSTVLREQLQLHGFCRFALDKEFRFWSADGPDKVTVVIGNAEELAKLDYDATYGEAG